VTVYDWNQANVNGVRQVLPHIDGGLIWAASVYSGGRNLAWYFDGYDGYVYYGSRSPMTGLFGASGVES
jgi:hypothetical protein